MKLRVPEPTLDIDLPMAPLEVAPSEVFTRQWIVDFILDLASYHAERDLAAMVAVEPACGTGAFLGPMIARLSDSCKLHGKTIVEATGAINAYDLAPRNVKASRQLVERTLIEDGWSTEDAVILAETWVQEGDYLLAGRRDGDVDFVIVNPPYIRLEDVSSDRMSAYRSACTTMTGRSDVYVGFFEVGLRSLKTNGVLAFICADRWMRNQYGRHLRQLINDNYNVDATIVMHDVDAFDEQVSAYPAITVLHRGSKSSSVVAEARKSFDPGDAQQILTWTRRAESLPMSNDRFEVARLPHWFEGGRFVAGRIIREAGDHRRPE